MTGSPTTQLACADPDGICTVLGTGGSSNPFDGSAGRPNMFAGRAAGNTVTFPAVPLDGASRLYRITNLRVNAASVAAGPNSSPTPVLATLSFSNGLSIAQVVTGNAVGYVSPIIDFSLRSPDSNTVANSSGFGVGQCSTPQRVATFRVLGNLSLLRRSFAAYVDSDTSPTPVSWSLPGVFALTQTGFYNPALSAPTVNFATLGLADAGTRMRGTVTDIPLGPKCS